LWKRKFPRPANPRALIFVKVAGHRGASAAPRRGTSSDSTGELPAPLAACGGMTSMEPTKLARRALAGLAAVAAIAAIALPARAADPLTGDLLIADRGGGRLLVIDPQKQIVWSQQLTWKSPQGIHSRWADDAFLTPDHQHIIFNEEDNQAIDIMSIATGEITWSYGHPGVKGAAPGYLNTPDDAFQLPDGTVEVSDIANQRVIFIDPKTKQIVRQYGTTGKRGHAPPRLLNAPDGAYPTEDGGLLVTEIGWGHGTTSFLDRIGPDGKLGYSIKTDMTYASDGNVTPHGNVIAVDYEKPGSVEIYSPQGKVLWRYRPASGAGELNHPSNAIVLPNGNILVCDDWNDRVMVIDRQTKAIVWSYGHLGVARNAPGYLNIPDEVVFIPPEWNVDWTKR
jgi:DNA-binding beta-propeller fold protein YncE